MSWNETADPACTTSTSTRAIDIIIDAQPRAIDGIPVGRVLPSATRRLVGPFIFFDHFGPAELLSGAAVDVRPHPHINLATVTYLFEGEIVHRDSLGSEQTIRPGAVNWMTAGRAPLVELRFELERANRAGKTRLAGRALPQGPWRRNGVHSAARRLVKAKLDRLERTQAVDRQSSTTAR